MSWLSDHPALLEAGRLLAGIGLVIVVLRLRAWHWLSSFWGR